MAKPRSEVARDYYLRNRETIQARQRQYRARRRSEPGYMPPDQRPFQLRHLYGVTVDTVDYMLDCQGGLCAACGKLLDGSTKSRKPHVDHDHSTGATRGILCGTCNTGIGMLGDSEDGVARALAYLERSRTHG